MLPTRIRSKDYITTREGLCFAVLADRAENGRIPVSLRYQQVDGCWVKRSTDAASRLLSDRYPHYLFHSKLWDTQIPGVRIESVCDHLSALRLTQTLLNRPIDGHASLEGKAQLIVKNLLSAGVNPESLGITGSLLVGASSNTSDIDLVIYDRTDFALARRYFQAYVQRHPPTAADWQAAFAKRGTDLDLDAFVWHEQRKFNKIWLADTKVDLSLSRTVPLGRPAKKLGQTQVTAQVTDDSGGFDFPARWRVKSDDINEVVCWTATYTGQAFHSEWIHAAGWLEETANGSRRLIVGTSREARNEFIRVVSG